MLAQDTQGTSTVGKHWAALRATPTATAHWWALAQAYALGSWPWHLVYALTQARRCAAAQGQVGLPEPGPALSPECLRSWGDRELLLINGAEAPAMEQLRARLEQAVAQEPDDWLSWLYLTRCRELMQPLADSAPNLEARAAVRRALALEPLPGETGHLLAQWRLRSGQPAQALAALQAVLTQAPHRHGSWLLKAEAHMQLGMLAEAQRAFEQAGRSPNPDFLALVADKLFQFNFAHEAQGVCEAVVQLRPGHVPSWLQLAEIQAKLWQVDQAQASLAQALALDPGHAHARQWAEDLRAAGDSRQQFEQALARFEAQGLQANAQGAQRLLMQSLYQTLAPEFVADLHRRVGQGMEAQARQHIRERLPPPNPLPWDGRRRLRVGYVTGDLHRQHPVNVFMLPVLLRHDHRALEVFVYQTGTFIDEYTRQARACTDHWREVAHLSDSALHQRVVDDRIDVLVDLAGHTASHRLGVFALRAAPVQLSYLGYPHSTGLACMDGMIGDAVVASPEHAHLFSETVHRVSGSVFCWAPVDDYPLPPDPLAPRSGDVVFASFNNLLKVNDQTLAVWARILAECPGSRLLLKSAVLADPSVRRQTLERLAALGVGAERLELRGPTELSRMMQEYLDVDVALDPFPYNGGTTSLQALWMGCPLVSLEGGNFVSRMGASFLTHLGRPEWLARSIDDYVRTALALGRQAREQPWPRRQLRAAMQASGLCQIERHTREMEAIYQQAFLQSKAVLSPPQAA